MPAPRPSEAYLRQLFPKAERTYSSGEDGRSRLLRISSPSHPTNQHDPSKALFAFWHPHAAVGRVLLAVACGAVAGGLSPSAQGWLVRGLLGWDVGALVFLAVAWHTILRASALETQKRASADDPGRNAVWAITVAACFVSLFAAVYVFRLVRSWNGLEGALWTALALLAVVLSWVLTHTLYTFRYARLYYRHSAPFGLEFPGGRKPADIDFAYFSFTVGMTFQVSDVVVTCSRIRRTTLAHALLSFVYNTTIISIAMNLAFTALAH